MTSPTPEDVGRAVIAYRHEHCRFGNEWMARRYPDFLTPCSFTADCKCSAEYDEKDMEREASAMRAALAAMPDHTALLRECAEALGGLKFGAYPAHGSGFVTILVEGDLAKVESTLARVRAALGEKP